MNGNKLNRLFAAARRERMPEPGEQFAAGVMRAVRREPAGAPGVFAQLGEWFPRLALASAAMILVFLAVDLCASAWGPADLEGGVAQLSEQWLFATKGF